MGSPSLLCFGLGFLILFHACSAQIEQVTTRDTTEEQQRQRQQQQRFQTQCNIQNLNALEPRQSVESEAGVTEFWDQDNPQLQCANVAVFRHRIQQNGLLVPAYTNTAELFYVVQGRGIHGVVFPGCPETFQDQQQQQSYQSQGSRSQDQHQKVRQIREGDIIALPTGAAHWVYNNGGNQLVLVALVDVGNSDNQLDQYFRKFYLGGNPQPQLQGTSQRQQGSGSYQGSQGGGGGGGGGSRSGNMFNGFDERLLAEAFNVNPELIRRLQRPQMQRGIIVRVEEEFRVLSPQRGQEQEQEQEFDNGVEETFCTMTLRHNINDPSRADVYNPRGGRVTTVNRFNLPVLRWLQLSAEKGNLYQNALTSPHWNLNCHSIVYITRGSGRMQIVSENGNDVFNGQIREGQLIVVPQGFAVVKKASNRGLEWIAFKTSDYAMTNQLAGRVSVMRALPLDVIQNSFQVSRDEALKLKYNRQEMTVLTPAPGSQNEA